MQMNLDKYIILDRETIVPRLAQRTYEWICMLKVPLAKGLFSFIYLIMVVYIYLVSRHGTTL
jgi:hypothetical protein